VKYIQNKILQDLSSTVTVNKLLSKTKKVIAVLEIYSFLAMVN